MSPKESSSSSALHADIACSDWTAEKSDEVRRVQGGERGKGGEGEYREGKKQRERERVVVTFTFLLLVKK